MKMKSVLGGVFVASSESVSEGKNYRRDNECDRK